MMSSVGNERKKLKRGRNSKRCNKRSLLINVSSRRLKKLKGKMMLWLSWRITMKVLKKKTCKPKKAKNH